MIQFILMLLGLAFSNNNANTACDNTQPSTTVLSTTNSGSSLDPGDGNGGPGNGNGGNTGGNTGQTPPPFIQP